MGLMPAARGSSRARVCPRPPCCLPACCAPASPGIFGQRLEDTVYQERKYGSRLAPMLVEQCVDFIRERGLAEEGLFRLPGQADLVRGLQDSFDCGQKPLFDSTTDVHTVASLLKLYLRELPEPVIPFARYEDFLSCAQLLTKDEGEGTLELAKQVCNLPQANYNLLKYICKFLDEVQSHSDVNKMSVQNLATVFGPNILRPPLEDPVTIMEGAGEEGALGAGAHLAPGAFSGSGTVAQFPTSPDLPRSLPVGSAVKGKGSLCRGWSRPRGRSLEQLRAGPGLYGPSG